MNLQKYLYTPDRCLPDTDLRVSLGDSETIIYCNHDELSRLEKWMVLRGHDLETAYVWTLKSPLARMVKSIEMSKMLNTIRHPTNK